MCFSNSSYHMSLPLAPPSPTTSDACCSNVHSEIVQKLCIPPLYGRWTTMIFPVGLVPTCCRCDVIYLRSPLLPLSPSHSVVFRVWAWLVLLLSHILWLVWIVGVGSRCRCKNAGRKDLQIFPGNRTALEKSLLKINAICNSNIIYI